MRRFVIPVPVAGVMSALVLAGCGGGGGTSGSGSGTGTNAAGGSAFAAAANAACQRRSEIQLAATESAGSTAASAVGFTKTLGSAYQAEISSLKALTPPSSAKSQFDSFVADQESILG